MKRDEQGAGVFILLVMLLVWLFAMLTGCTTTEHIRLDKDPTAEAVCQPLPLCEVPPEASSTQLESALYACVLEYRALYSVCYHLVHPPTTSNLPPCDHRTAYPRRIPRTRCGNV